MVTLQQARLTLGSYLKQQGLDPAKLTSTGDTRLVDQVAAQTHLTRAQVLQLASEFSATPARDFTALTGPASTSTGYPPPHQALARAITDVATKASASQSDVTHALVERFGDAVGLTLGVIVTEALAVVPGWNKPVLDANGQPVKSVPGAVREGDYDIRKRHEEVVGPKIEAYVQTLKPGVVHDLLQGVAEGATDGPGTSYRIEAKVLGESS